MPLNHRSPAKLIQRAGELTRKWFALPAADRYLFGEALLYLALARVGIVLLPFASIGRIASRKLGDDNGLSPEARELLRQRVRRAIVAWASRVPWRAKCFEQGLAAQLMLRRRGVPTVLCYGARQDTKHGLLAHVWVIDEHRYVVGGELAPHYRLLMRFPPA